MKCVAVQRIKEHGVDSNRVSFMGESANQQMVFECFEPICPWAVGMAYEVEVRPAEVAQ
jgi:hypothetical protein